MILRRHTFSRTAQCGASAVEFALVLPVLLLILFGTIEFGLLLFNKQVLTNASREGARYGIVAKVPRRTNDEIQAVVNNYIGNHLITFGTSNNPIIAITRSGSNFGDDLTVRVQHTFGFLVMPNLVSSLSDGINLVAETVMKYE